MLYNIVYFVYDIAEGANLLILTVQCGINETKGACVSKKKAHKKQAVRKPARGVMLQGESCL